MSERKHVIDAFHELKRGPQIITQKDIGLILGMTGVSSPWRVVEAGSGSGALTTFLANAVQPGGKVYSYDWERGHLDIARENIENAGLSEYVEFEQRDIGAGFDQEDLDMVVLDLGSPWVVVPHAENALKSGGFFVSYIPTFEQLKEIYFTVRSHKFEDIEAYDLNVREYQVEEMATRPENKGLVHTGFILFARKI